MTHERVCHRAFSSSGGFGQGPGPDSNPSAASSLKSVTSWAVPQARLPDHILTTLTPSWVGINRIGPMTTINGSLATWHSSSPADTTHHGYELTTALQAKLV